MRFVVTISAVVLTACGPSTEQIKAEKIAQQKAVEQRAQATKARERARFVAKRAAEMKAVATKDLLDPRTAQFRSLKFHDGYLCGEINGKNAFGAYVGFGKFYVDFLNSASFRNQLQALEDNVAAGGIEVDRMLTTNFDERWDKCERNGEAAT